MNKILLGLMAIVLVTGLAIGCAAPKVESPQDFYKGKTITIVVTENAGGGIDLMARMLQPYLKEYTGAYAVVIDNVGEGGGMLGLNKVYTAEPDGLSIVARTLSTTFQMEVEKQAGLAYQAEKFNVLYALSTQVGNFLTVSATGKYKSIADLQKAKGLRTGGTAGKCLISGYFTDILGLDCRITPGIAVADARMSLIRGEIDFFNENAGEELLQMKAGTTMPLVRELSKRDPLLPDVPAINEVDKLSAQQQSWQKLLEVYDVGKYLFTTPGVPQDRVEYLRGVIDKIHSDPKFLEQRKTSKDPYQWLNGADATSMLKQLTGLGTEYSAMVQYLQRYYTIK